MRILALGDCNTLGSGSLEPAAFSFPNRLAERLRADGETIELRNLGGTMATTREGLSRMEDEGVAFAPDLLIVNFGLVDAWVTSIPGIYVPYYPDNRWRKIKRKLLKSVKRRLRGALLRRFIPIGEVVPGTEYQANLERIVALAREANPGVRVILLATMFTRSDRRRDENLACYNALVRRSAEACGARYLDTPALFEDVEQRDSLYTGEVHLVAEAHDRIAEALYRIIQGEREVRDAAP